MIRNKVTNVYNICTIFPRHKRKGFRSRFYYCFWYIKSKNRFKPVFHFDGSKYIQLLTVNNIFNKFRKNLI